LGGEGGECSEPGEGARQSFFETDPKNGVTQFWLADR
jgi:hypothetical protein